MPRRLVAWLAAGTIAAGAGCAGRQTRLDERNAKLEQENRELRAQRRRERRRVRDLENQVAKLEADDAPDAPPAVARPLPVEVRAPEAVPERDDFVDYEDESGEVAFVEDGVEVVYVGEAAEDDATRPRLTLHETRRPAPPPARAHTPPPPGRTPATPLRVEERIPSSDAPVAPIPTPKPKVEPAPKPKPAKPAAAEDPRAVYRRHYEALRAGDHEAAIAGFRAFIAAHPEHDYADNAQYWLGEAFYDQKQYRAALAEFARVVDDYPGGNKVPDALLKMGFCHLQLGDVPEAKKYLLRVVELYPKSNPAAIAADRLEKLDE